MTDTKVFQDMKRIALVAALAAAAPAFADTVAKPDKVVVCAACHGEKGISQTGAYPNLAGQYSSFIEHALHAYQTGERKNAIMGAQAAGLSKDEIKQLAAWFSQQEGTPLFTLARPKSPSK